MSSPWFQSFSGGPLLTDACALLVCVPHAGGTTTAFQKWQKAMPEGVLVLAASLPGRMRRMREPALKSMAPLVNELCNALTALNITCDQRPWSIFGHSMGACVAYEVCVELNRRGVANPPSLLIASGSRSPSWRASSHPHQRALRESGSYRPAYQLSNAEFIQHLAELGGTPTEVLENNELMEFCIPFLRADFELIETYEPSFVVSDDHNQHDDRQAAPLSIPIWALGGEADKNCPRKALNDWEMVSSGITEIQTFEGGHFFIDQAEENGMFQLLREKLNHHLFHISQQLQSAASSSSE